MKDLIRTAAAAAALALPSLRVFAGPPVLYVLEGFGNRLVRVDPSTGASSTVGLITGAGAVCAMAYDPAADVLYAASSSLHSLYRIDYNTLAPTLIGSFGLGEPQMHGLEWDISTGTLYVSRRSSPHPGQIGGGLGRQYRPGGIFSMPMLARQSGQLRRATSSNARTRRDSLRAHTLPIRDDADTRRRTQTPQKYRERSSTFQRDPHRPVSTGLDRRARP